MLCVISVPPPPTLCQRDGASGAPIWLPTDSPVAGDAAHPPGAGEAEGTGSAAEPAEHEVI